MNLGIFLYGALALCPGSVTATVPEDPAWTWVFGQVEDPKLQAHYVDFAARMFRFYQARRLLVGELVDQGTLEQWPTAHTVLIGPVEAFDVERWQGSGLQLLDTGGVRLLGRDLLSPRTGIYLRSPDGKHVFYTGLTELGFEDIFSTPTGTEDCTVLVDGVKRLEGSWAGGVLDLRITPFLPAYPSQEEIRSLGGVGKALTVGGVYGSAERSGFTPGFEQHLQSLVEDQRVLFVGESHWNHGVNWLFNRVVEFLLEHRAPRCVFLELNYSFSGHLNHYVRLADDGEAQRFLERHLHPLVNVQSLVDLVEILRRWNRDHPNRAVSVACSDMEWGLETTLKSVVSPFFEALEPGFVVADLPRMGERAWREQELVRLRKRLALEKGRPTPADLPFLTPEFIGQVLTNLEDTLTLGANPMQRRQEHIVRNIVTFHGDLLDSGFALFKGGGFHAQKNVPAEEGVYRDAAYLHQVHRTTRGRVATLGLLGVGVNFSAVASVDMTTRLGSATNYHKFVAGFQAGLPAGFAHEADHYILNTGGITPMELLVARAARGVERNTVWIKDVDAERLATSFGVAKEKSGVSDYDTRVYVLRSRLEPTRPLVYGQD